MISHLPAIAAFATAALQFAALAVLIVRGGVLAQAPTLEPIKAVFQLYLWPVPLVMAVALWGVLAAPVQRRALTWIGIVLFGLSGALLCLTSSIVLTVFSGESRPEAFMILFITPWPALTLAGAAAAMIGHKLTPAFGASRWFAALGGLIIVSALIATFVIFALYLALLALAAWWAWLGVVLSKAPVAQASTV